MAATNTTLDSSGYTTEGRTADQLRQDAHDWKLQMGFAAKQQDLQGVTIYGEWYLMALKALKAIHGRTPRI